jgi:hypothetical protein
MPITLQDLYAQPKFIEKVEQPVKAKIMRWTFKTANPKAINPLKAAAIDVSLAPVTFSDEDEERIQGEVIVTARIAGTASVTIRFKAQDQSADATENISQDFKGHMNFSLPWGWQAKDIRFVTESAQVALTELRAS